MAGEQPVIRRSDEYRLSDPKENVVLWHGGPLPEGLVKSVPLSSWTEASQHMLGEGRKFEKGREEEHASRRDRPGWSP